MSSIHSQPSDDVDFDDYLPFPNWMEHNNEGDPHQTRISVVLLIREPTEEEIALRLASNHPRPRVPLVDARWSVRAQHENTAAALEEDIIFNPRSQLSWSPSSQQPARHGQTSVVGIARGARGYLRRLLRLRGRRPGNGSEESLSPRTNSPDTADMHTTVGSEPAAVDNSISVSY
jgi:hypothetical protein